MSDLPLSIEDQLILSTLVYVDFHPFVKDEASISILDASLKVLADPERKEKHYRVQNDEILLEWIVKSPRFSTLAISDSVEFFDKDKARQFYAFSVHLPCNNQLVLCFRGTDLTLTGWKEDFEMSFSDVVPAQQDALDYLENVARKYPDAKLVLTGHSKGGNLALFAALNASKEVQDRIEHVYNNDGPGFNEESSSKDKVPLLKDRITTLVPSSSIIGILMEHTLEYTVVESSSKSIFQHDPYSWLLDGPHFLYADKRSEESYLMDRISREWLSLMSREERAHFVDVVFSILESIGEDDLRKYGRKLISNRNDIIKAYRSLGVNERTMLRRISRNFARIAGRNILGIDSQGGKALSSKP